MCYQKFINNIDINPENFECERCKEEDMLIPEEKIKCYLCSKFDGIMALKDAADLWNLDDSTLRHAIASNRFKCAKDVTKFGKQWVITIEAMVREYGEPKH